MAKKTTTLQQPMAIACAKCGNTIPPAEKLGFPVDAIWRDGMWICWDCLRKSGKIELRK